jgi:hypothetical protein
VEADASAGFGTPAGTALPPSVDPIGGVEPIAPTDAAVAEEAGVAVAGGGIAGLPIVGGGAARDAGARDVRPRDAASASTADAGFDDGGAGDDASAGAAGAGGSAGVPPSAGVQAAVGQSSTTGAAGRAGVADDPCASLERDYAAALSKALECDYFALGPTCQQKADTSLSCPGCQVAVQDPSRVLSVADQWQASGCAARRDCPAIVCANLGNGICIPNGPSVINGPASGICDGVTAVMPGSSR